MMKRAFQMFGENPKLVPIAPVLLYATLGPTLPDGAAAAAPLYAACHRTAMEHPIAVQRALATTAEPPMLGEDALREAAREPLGLRLHRARVRRDLPAREAPRRQDPPRRAGDARLAPHVSIPPPERTIPRIRSRSSPASAACTTPTRSSARRPGGRAIPTARSASIPTTSPRSAPATAAGWRSQPRPGGSSAGSRVDASMRRGLVALPHGYGQSYPDGHGNSHRRRPRV